MYPYNVLKAKISALVQGKHADQIRFCLENILRAHTHKPMRLLGAFQIHRTFCYDQGYLAFLCLLFLN